MRSNVYAPFWIRRPPVPFLAFLTKVVLIPLNDPRFQWASIVNRRHLLRLVAAASLVPTFSQAVCATSIDSTLRGVRTIEVFVLIVAEEELKRLVPYDAIKPHVIRHIKARLGEAGFKTSVVDNNYVVAPSDDPERTIIVSIRIDLQHVLIEDRQVVLGAVSVDFVRRGSEATAGEPLVSPDSGPMTLFTASNNVPADDCLKATLRHIDNAIIAPYLILNNPDFQ